MVRARWTWFFRTAGAAVLSVPSNEIYAAMQTGACDAGITSSTSLISFRLEEVAKHLTSGAGQSYWFMLEPLMMSRAIFDKLPKIIRTSSPRRRRRYGSLWQAGRARRRCRGRQGLREGGRKSQLTGCRDRLASGEDIARDTAWKDYSAKTANCTNLMKLASERLRRMTHGLVDDRHVPVEPASSNPLVAGCGPYACRLQSRDRRTGVARAHSRVLDPQLQRLFVHVHARQALL